MSYPQIRCALAACDRRDSSFALQQIETIHAAVAPLAAGEKGMSAYEKCVDFLMRPFRGGQAKPDTEKRKDTLFRHAKNTPLTASESAFAAAARARLGMQPKP